MAGPRRIAVVGTGIAGLAAAYFLKDRHDVVVYEKDARLGGHANTVTVDYDGAGIAVDTGFIVYNEVNYPELARLFADLGVETDASNMSFSVSAGDGALEWAGDNLRTVFAQKRNLARPRFLGMLRDIARFNRQAAIDLGTGGLGDLSLGDYIARGRYGDAFRRDYLLPMGAAIWSTPAADMMAFPAASFIRFFNNHALLRGLDDRHQWRTVRGGSQRYVNRIAAALGARVRLACPVVAIERDAFGVTLRDAGGHQDRFDEVVLATHGDQALKLLATPTDAERRLLGAFRYAGNHAVLHRDPTLMPRRRAIWSSWNYLSSRADRRDECRTVSLCYWMNRLQNIDHDRPLFVSLNPPRNLREDLVFARFDYEHPMFDAAAIAAQRRLAEIQGANRVWFAGSYCGNGFHEDGLRAAIAVANALDAPPAWAAERRLAAE
ncbi:FAD-dependent oxidoreductase [Oleomonas cavernae]|uniref:FAD-dependent oxidoreductase n=2 Tax=Oleomonas cavernae TaxID=2320859 RepID=A0A418WIZ9_9PROT|nr:FAD-dependent oxidoreductase [Oleomonas cavernae]